MNQTVRGADAPNKLDANVAAGAAPVLSMRYGIYALAVLVLVNMFALVDRHILSVLIEDIKADLRLSDAEIGFVYGTAISVFYVIFSIPLGRLADVWSRTNLLAGCVAVWSVMIFLTGSARNFLSFALFRAGVGIGEAGCYPAVMSLVSDYFPPRLRSTAMSIAVAGIPLGSGLGLLLGGVILDAWNGAYPDPRSRALGAQGLAGGVLRSRNSGTVSCPVAMDPQRAVARTKRRFG